MLIHSAKTAFLLPLVVICVTVIKHKLLVLFSTKSQVLIMKDPMH